MIWTKLYDPDRAPPHWTEIVRVGQYCVFLIHAADRTPRDREGLRFVPGRDSAAICATRQEATEFAATIVSRHPELCAEVYDHQGKSGEPLETMYEPSVRGRYTGRPYAKREMLRGLGFLCCSAFFIMQDVRHHLEWMWGYIIGLKLLLVGGSYTVRGLIGLYENRKSPA